MAQVTIYMDNQLEQKIRSLAHAMGISMSKFIANTLEQTMDTTWGDDVKRLSGTWDDFPDLHVIRTTCEDSQREIM